MGSARKSRITVTQSHCTTCITTIAACIKRCGSHQRWKRDSRITYGVLRNCAHNCRSRPYRIPKLKRRYSARRWSESLRRVRPDQTLPLSGRERTNLREKRLRIKSLLDLVLILLLQWALLLFLVRQLAFCGRVLRQVSMLAFCQSHKQILPYVRCW